MLLNLRKEMMRNKYTNTTIAETLGVHHNTAVSKVSGKTAFTVDEALLLQEKLFPYYTDIKELFRNEVTDNAGEV